MLRISSQLTVSSLGTINVLISVTHPPRLTVPRLHDGPKQPSPLDTPNMRYLTLRRGVSSFIIIQLGLCCFHRTEDNQWIATPFRFYVYPRSVLGVERYFSCQSSSLSFLKKSQFDFNKLVEYGLSYLSVEEEAQIRLRQQAQLEQRQKRAKASDNRDTGTTSALTPADDAVLEASRQKLQDFLTSTSAQARITAIDGYSPPEVCTLPEGNSFVRYHQHAMIRKDFPQLRSYTEKRGTYPLVVAQRMTGSKRSSNGVTSPRERESDRDRDSESEQPEGGKDGSPHSPVNGSSRKRKRLTEEREREKKGAKLIMEAIGVRAVLDYVTASGKLVAGHNFQLDALHLVSQFVGKLPPHVDGFKTMVHDLFPNFLDTRIVSGASLAHAYRDAVRGVLPSGGDKENENEKVPSFPHTLPTTLLLNNTLQLSLAPEVTHCFSLPKHDPPPQHLKETPDFHGGVPPVSKEASLTGLHDAAADAFATGAVLLSQWEKCNPDHSETMPQPWRNHIFASHLPNHMDLTGPDEVPSRENVFYLSCLPRNEADKKAVIARLLDPYATGLPSHRLYHCGEREAFLLLQGYTEDELVEFYQANCGDGNGWRLHSYEEIVEIYETFLNTPNPPALLTQDLDLIEEQLVNEYKKRRSFCSIQ